MIGTSEQIDRFFSKPLALWRGYEPALLSKLREAGSQSLPLQRQDASRCFEIVDGIAIIPIQGVLVHCATWYAGETEYKWIHCLLKAALADHDAKAICLYVNSPGGEVAGCFDLADFILAARAQKPIWAILDECAYSAAYALACTADKIFVPRTGGTGSIGVISMHMDITKALDLMGLKVTTFQYGDRKSDAYPTTPLSDEAAQRYQDDVNALGEMFVALVAKARPQLSAKAIRAMQAATYLGQAGVDVGLADAVISPLDAFESFAACVAQAL